MKKNILTMMAAALLVVGLMACGGSSNPLNIEAPTWEKFAHPKSDGVKLYMSADESSPKLQIAMEPCDGDACDIQVIWAGEWIPRGWTANDWDVSTYDAFPILAEEGDYYKVYVSNDWLGAAEAYMKKSDCDVVRPANITQEVLDSVGKNCSRRDYVIQDGELENLCFSSCLGEYDGIEFEMGQLCGNCLVIVNSKPIWLSQSNEDTGIKIVPGESENEADRLEFGKDDYWSPNEESAWLFDTKKLDNELVNELFNKLRPDSVEVTQAYYYLPDVDKGRIVPIYLFADVKKGKGDESAAEEGHPFFGDILTIYGEKLKEGKDYRVIRQEMEDVLNKSRGREIPVKGEPFGIKTSKAVITKWNMQSFCLNIIVEFIPDEGTDFNKITADYVSNIIYCRAMSSNGAFFKRAAHVDYPPTPNLYVTLIIDSKGRDGYDSRWDNLEYIELSDRK